jgi:hypothetical protein
MLWEERKGFEGVGQVIKLFNAAMMYKSSRIYINISKCYKLLGISCETPSSSMLISQQRSSF